jgi:hypothetical protein
MPTGKMDDEVVYCGAVGNTLKVVRRKAFPLDQFEPKLGAYGDDGMVSTWMISRGWDVAFCRNIYCWHAGQCHNWGYTDADVAKDPRKAGYGKPFIYEPLDKDTYLPPPELRIG